MRGFRCQKAGSGSHATVPLSRFSETDGKVLNMALPEMKDPPEWLLQLHLELGRALQILCGSQYEAATRQSGYLARVEWQNLLTTISNTLRLEHFGRKIYSQNEEDGIIEQLFFRLDIKPGSGVFIEIGVQDGLECNTVYLLHAGFSGTWIDTSTKDVAQIRERFALPLQEGRLAIRNKFVTAENIDEILATCLRVEDKVVVLSIDIDGNDFWIWKAVSLISPLIIVIEYNGKFPPPLSCVQKYDPAVVWRGTDYFGASLTALVKLGRAKGYSLVACNITGINAFFVRDDLIKSNFPFALTAENLYHPCRYHLTQDCFSRFGHRPDFGPYVNVDEELLRSMSSK